MECKNTSFIFVDLQMHSPYISVSMYNSQFVLSAIVKCFTNAIFFKLSSNNITTICGQLLFDSLVFVDLGFNSIKSIRRHCLKNLTNLNTVLLDNNNIIFMESNSFFDLSKLKFLSLSNNPLFHIPKRILTYSNFTLKKSSILLSLMNIKLFDIDLNVFQDIDIHVINTNDHHICCVFTTKTKCTATIPWHISCSDMLPVTSMKIIFFVIALAVLVVNLISSFLHVVNRKSNAAFLFQLYILMFVIYCILYI